MRAELARTEELIRIQNHWLSQPSGARRPAIVPLGLLNLEVGSASLQDQIEEITPIDLRHGLERAVLNQILPRLKHPLKEAFIKKAREWATAYEAVVQMKVRLFARARDPLFERRRVLQGPPPASQEESESRSRELKSIDSELNDLSSRYDAEKAEREKLYTLFPDISASVDAEVRQVSEGKRGAIKEAKVVRKLAELMAAEESEVAWTLLNQPGGAIHQLRLDYQNPLGPETWEHPLSGQVVNHLRNFVRMLEQKFSLQRLNDAINAEETNSDDRNRYLELYRKAFHVDQSSHFMVEEEKYRAVFLADEGLVSVKVPGYGQFNYWDKVGTSILTTQGLDLKDAQLIVVFGHGTGANISNALSFGKVLAPFQDSHGGFGMRALSVNRPGAPPRPSISFQRDQSFSQRAAFYMNLSRNVRQIGNSDAPFAFWGRSCGGRDCLVQAFFTSLQYQGVEDHDAESLMYPDVLVAQSFSPLHNGDAENRHLDFLVRSTAGKGSTVNQLFHDLLEHEARLAYELIPYLEEVVRDYPHRRLQYAQEMVIPMGITDDNYNFDPLYVQNKMIMNHRYYPLAYTRFFNDPLMNYEFLNNPNHPQFLYLDPVLREGGHYLISSEKNMNRTAWYKVFAKTRQVGVLEADQLSWEEYFKKYPDQKALADSVSEEDLPQAYNARMAGEALMFLRMDEMIERPVLATPAAEKRVERLKRYRDRQLSGTNYQSLFEKLMTERLKLTMAEIDVDAALFETPRSLLGRFQRIYWEHKQRQEYLKRLLELNRAPETPSVEEWDQTYDFDRESWKWVRSNARPETHTFDPLKLRWIAKP